MAARVRPTTPTMDSPRLPKGMQVKTHLEPVANTLAASKTQTVYIKSPPGSGKTSVMKKDVKRLLQHAAQSSSGPTYACAVCPCKASALQMQKDLQEALAGSKVQVRLPPGPDRATDETPVEWGKCHAVFHVDALHTLYPALEAHPGAYAVLVVDESESVLAQLDPVSAEADVLAFQKLAEDAKYAIWMDSLLAERTIYVGQAMRGYKTAMMINNSHKGQSEPDIEAGKGPQKMIEILTGPFEQKHIGPLFVKMMHKLIKEMTARGERTYILSSSKTVLQKIYEQAKVPHESIVRFDPETKRRHPWPSALAPDVRTVLASPSTPVAIGVDVTFDRRFIVAVPGLADPMAIVKNAERIRKFTNQITYFAVFPRPNRAPADVFPVFDIHSLLEMAKKEDIHDNAMALLWAHNTRAKNASWYFFHDMLVKMWKSLGYAVIPNAHQS